MCLRRSLHVEGEQPWLCTFGCVTDETERLGLSEQASGKKKSATDHNWHQVLKPCKTKKLATGNWHLAVIKDCHQRLPEVLLK